LIGDDRLPFPTWRLTRRRRRGVFPMSFDLRTFSAHNLSSNVMPPVFCHFRMLSALAWTRTFPGAIVTFMFCLCSNLIVRFNFQLPLSPCDINLSISTVSIIEHPLSAIFDAVMTATFLFVRLHVFDASSTCLMSNCTLSHAGSGCSHSPVQRRDSCNR
jgi:hypothetical protein